MRICLVVTMRTFWLACGPGPVSVSESNPLSVLPGLLGPPSIQALTGIR
jgi:hypothetical protein